MAGNTPAAGNFRQSVRRGPHFRESSIKQLRKRLPCQDFVQTDQTNRRNARKSTGPISEEDKGRPRCNAIRHGLTAETVIGALEDAEDYNAFQAAVAAGFDAETAVERELVLRLASLLWRLRRATAIDTGFVETPSEPDIAPDPGGGAPANERAAAATAYLHW